MLTINKITSNSTVDYAAEELKKYFRMMMPEGGDIRISYDPEAKEGFRLGLMQDFGLDVSDAEDTELDDILYINCDTCGGVIAGDNPRSVLLSVYEYLRQNGCRWLFPGVDGEYIPMQDIKAVEYRHKPSCRFRGWCNEGAEYQECMMETIDFIPKVGMNVYMLEFRVPVAYYDRYYNHPHNPTLNPEPLSKTQIVQWKRQCEAEIAKRGLQFHDIGHGWCSEAFGIPAECAWEAIDESTVPEEAKKYLALLGDERKLWNGQPMNTNFCMSNPEARRIFASYIADYAEGHSNIDYLHVWLSDGVNNHCECDECRKKNPSDFYVMAMNDLDRELTRRNLTTRIVFIVYTDTTWPPLTEKIERPDRFSILLAPITRSYSYTTDEGYVPKLTPYVRNDLTYPETLDEYFAYFEKWKENWHGTAFSYEYHFWHHQYRDMGGINYSKRINEDIKEYKKRGVNGIVEDGSQRSFFPTGLPFYTYARTLYDTALSPEEIANEYFAAAFGEGADEFKSLMTDLSGTFEFGYLMGECSQDTSVSPFYCPDYADKLEANFPKLCKKGEELVKKYYNSEYRICTVSVRLIEKHLIFCDFFAKALIQKSRGNDAKAKEIYCRWRDDFGRMEYELRRYFDNFLFFRKYGDVFVEDKSRKKNATEL